MRIAAGLVLDEGRRVPHLPDVVVVRAHACDEWIGADHLGCALGEVRHEQRVVIRAGRAQQQLPQQRMVRIRELTQLEDRGDAEQVAEHRHRRECEHTSTHTRRERREEQLRGAERIRGPSDERERRQHADVADRDEDRAGRELARGRRAAHRGHAQEGGHEHVRDELDLPRHDPGMQRTGDLRRERGAAGHEHRERHRDRGVRDEIDQQRVAGDERARRDGQREEREREDHQLAVVVPRLGRVALGEQSEDARDEQRPDQQPDGGRQVEARVRKTERAQLLDVERGDDAALSYDDLTRDDLHLHGGDGAARGLLRHRRGHRIEHHVGVEELPHDLGPDALLPVGPGRRQRLSGLGLDRFQLLGTDALSIKSAKRVVELLLHRIPLGRGHVDDICGQRRGEGDLRRTRDRCDLLIAQERWVAAHARDRRDGLGQMVPRCREHRRVRRVLLRDGRRGAVALGLGQRVGDEGDRARGLHRLCRDRAGVVGDDRGRREQKGGPREQTCDEDKDPHARARRDERCAQIHHPRWWPEATDHCSWLLSCRSYARTIRATSSCRTTSFSPKSTKAMPSVPCRMSRATTRPDF